VLTNKSRAVLVDAFKQARELISDPERWRQCTDARDETGHPVMPWDKHATRWCFIGAVRKVVNNMPISTNYIRTLTAANDVSTHAETLAMVDAEIQAITDGRSPPATTGS